MSIKKLGKFIHYKYFKLNTSSVIANEWLHPQAILFTGIL